MEFRYSLTILFSNMGYVLKIMVWILISLLITAAVGAAMLIPIWNALASTTGVTAIANGIYNIASEIWNGGLNMRVAIYDIVPRVIKLLAEIATKPGIATGLVFAVVFLYILYSFIMGLSYYTIADIINKLMSANLRFGFASNMALNFKKCCKYSIGRLIVSLPIDLIVIASGLAMAYGLLNVVGVFTLAIMLVMGVLFFSLKALLFSGWLPRVLHHPEEKLFISFTRAFPFVKANLGGLFKSYVITFSCSYLLAAAFTVPTCGLMLLLLPSIYYFLLRAVELVGYYKTKGFKFYADSTTVVNTVEFGFRLSNQEGLNEENGEAAASAVGVSRFAQSVVSKVGNVFAQSQNTEDVCADEGIAESGVLRGADNIENLNDGNIISENAASALSNETERNIDIVQGEK